MSAGNGYPALSFPVPGGGWDLSHYAGVQIDVSNKGTGSINVALRIDNAGDWKKGPFNTESVRVAPSKTKTLKVIFDKFHGGNPGHALNAPRVSNFKVFLVNPKEEATIGPSNLKGFDTATGAAGGTAPAAVSGASSVAGSVQGDLFDASASAPCPAAW